MKLLKGLVLCFYSREFYYEVARTWRGIGMGFILLLTLFMSLGMSCFIVLIPEIREAIAQFPAKAQAFPAITMTNGHLSIDKQSPYQLSLGDTPGKTAWIVIDTRPQNMNSICGRIT